MRMLPLSIKIMVNLWYFYLLMALNSFCLLAILGYGAKNCFTIEDVLYQTLNLDITRYTIKAFSRKISVICLKAKICIECDLRPNFL